METSKKFRFNLPSRDGEDIADIDVISQNFKKIDAKVPHVNEVSPAINNKVGGNAVKLTDISPLEHTLGLKVGGISYKDGDTLKSSPVTEVERWGENISKPSNTESWGVATEFESDGKVVLTTTTAYSSQYARVATATLKKDTPYIVSVVSPNNVKSVRVWKTGTYEDLSSTGSITHTFTLNEDTSVDIAIYAIDNSPVGTVTSGYVVLVQGTTDTHQTFTVPETVQALKGYGDGINETSYNYVDFEKKQFVKRCKRYVLNGNSDEGWYENTNGQFITGINVYGAKPNSEALCNLYKYDKTETPINTFFVGSAGIAFNTIFETTEEWKAYLAELYALGNPLTILCELATPEITDISNLLTNAKTLTSIYPETNLYTDNENGYLDVTYSVDTKKYIDKKFAELQALILNA